MSDTTRTTGSDELLAVWNRPEDERAGHPLMIMFHGYGSHEHDLLGLAPQLPEEFTVVSLRAPQVLQMGFQWFPLSQDPAYSDDQVLAAVHMVSDWIDANAADFPSITLLGFSQGMCVATCVARHRPDRIAAVVGLSGFVAPLEAPEFLDEQLERTPMKLFWGRGLEDQVIAEQYLDFTVEWCKTHADLTKVAYAGMAHSINAQEVRHVNEYLEHVVLKPLRQGR